ncbi:MAG: TonB-dependent receptor [Bacteroidales bacterium]|nr:TonB-dependent receptor [Bacteroidales bacterium]
MLLLIVSGHAAFAQNTITGSVFDESGYPLTGTSVMVEGTTVGTITDIDGKYTIKADKGNVLLFDFIGFNPERVTVGEKTVIDVVMTPSTEFLEETVVVGYGVQKKVNVTGAVATVNYADIAESRPVTTTAAMLRGASAGVQVSQTSSMPGAETIDIKVRGVGTLNDASPLVIVDGFESSLSKVNPSDIETISILKDAASCAIYGNRGANGVVLVTTKTAKEGTSSIEYSAIFSYQEPANTLEQVSNYADYMEFMNEAAYNIGKENVYSQAKIDLWRAAEKDPYGIAESGYPNYVAYPNVAWMEEMFTPGIYQKHSLSATGADSRTRYRVSLDFMDNPGVFASMGIKKIQFRTNVSSNVTDWLEIGARFFGYRSDRETTDWGSQMGMIARSLPSIYPYYDGKFGWYENTEDNSLARNSWYFIHQANGMNTSHDINATAYFNIKLPYGFKYSGSFNYKWNDVRSVFKRYPSSAYSFSRGEVAYDQTDLSRTSANETNTNSYDWTVSTNLSWNRSFGKHDVSAIAGFEAFEYNYKYSYMSKIEFSNEILTEFDNLLNPNEVKGNSSSYSTASVFGRASYAYDGRYMAEVNFRYDGSSRFASESRWGFFPSVSAGWRMNKEPWMENLDFIDNLKLRASWGMLGNHSIGNYDYISRYGSGYNYVFGEDVLASGYVSTLSNNALEWETTTTTDIGLDFASFDNRLTFEGDFYNKLTDGILASAILSSSLGTKSAPKTNMYSILNRGIELTLAWRDSVGDFSYGVSANFTRNWNKVLKYRGAYEAGWVTDENGVRHYETNYGEATASSGMGYSTSSRIIEGRPVGEIYLLPVYEGTGEYFFPDGSVNPDGGPRDGMIRTEDDMRWLEAMFAAGNAFGPQNKTIGKSGIWYGDYILADTNGDGFYGSDEDRKSYGSFTPLAFYGFNFNLAWKGIDLSLDLIGTVGSCRFWKAEAYNGYAMSSNTTFPARYAYDHYFYDPENPDDPRTNLTSKNGRLTLDYGAEQNGGNSTLWLYDTDYLKVKAVTIGYTLPKKWMDKIKVKNLRIYLSGDNLFTFTKYPGVDPEYVNYNNLYSSLRQYSLGLNIAF